MSLNYQINKMLQKASKKSQTILEDLGSRKQISKEMRKTREDLKDLLKIVS